MSATACMSVPYFEHLPDSEHVQVSRYGAFHSDNRLESMNKKYNEGLSLEKVPVSTPLARPARLVHATRQGRAGHGTAQWCSSEQRSALQPVAGEIRCPRRRKGKVL